MHRRSRRADRARSMRAHSQSAEPTCSRGACVAVMAFDIPDVVLHEIGHSRQREAFVAEMNAGSTLTAKNPLDVDASAYDIALALRSGAVSASEVIEATFARIAA